MTPSIWTGMAHAHPLHGAIAMLHACGWNAFEISSEHLIAIETDESPDERIAEALDVIDRLSLSAPQAHALLAADVAHPDKAKREDDIRRLRCHLDLASRLGVKNVVMHAGGKYRSPEVSVTCILDRTVEAFKPLGDFAGEQGLRIGMENLMRPGLTTPDELGDLLTRIDRPAFGITLDTSHAHSRGLDVAQTVRDFGSLLVGTHISDNDGTSDQHLIPGEGSIAWPSVVAALREIDYTGLFNLEIPGARNAAPDQAEQTTRQARKVVEKLLA